jgi:hypothetical protein
MTAMKQTLKVSQSKSFPESSESESACPLRERMIAVIASIRIIIRVIPVFSFSAQKKNLFILNDLLPFSLLSRFDLQLLVFLFSPCLQHNVRGDERKTFLGNHYFSSSLLLIFLLTCVNTYFFSFLSFSASTFLLQHSRHRRCSIYRVLGMNSPQATRHTRLLCLMDKIIHKSAHTD